MKKLSTILLLFTILFTIYVVLYLLDLITWTILIAIGLAILSLIFLLNNRVYWATALTIFLCCLGKISLVKLGPINIHPYQVPLVISVLGLLLYFIKNNQTFSFPYFYLLGIFLLVVFIGIPKAHYPLVSIKQSLLLIAFISLFLLIVNTCNGSEEIGLAYKAIIFSALLVYSYGIYKMIRIHFGGLPVGYKYYFLRPSSFFVEGNELGQYMTFVFGFLLIGLISDIEIINRKLLWILFSMHISLTVLNMSRGAWLGMIATVLAIIIVAYRSYNWKKLATYAIFAVLILFITLYNVDKFIPSQHSTIRQVILHRSRSLFTETDPTVLSRYNQSIIAAKAAIRNPIFGVGFGNIFTIMPFGISSSQGGIAGIPQIGNATSSNFVFDLAAETGIPGAILFLIFLAKIMINSFKVRMNICNPHVRMVYDSALYSSIGLIVEGLTYSIHMEPFLWISIGILSIPNVYKKE